jgi:NAD(P)-dependent dehydrogenase (short-subunit alcohol dehydrogenase family)
MSKKYLVIGASSGIGKQSAEQLASLGFEVYGTYNKKETSSTYSNLEFFPLNVLDESPNFDFLPETLDGLVYCPGNISLRPFARIKSEDFMADFNLQVLGAIRCIQAVLPRLKNSENASIVLFSTVAVQLGLGFHSQVAVSKGAIEGLTRALAAELAPKIRVNCIAPSLTDTPLAASLLSSDEKREANAQRHPLKKIGTTQDIANMVEFLVTDKSSWMSGQILHLDGGMSSLKV